jgi:hypothetical protein
MTKFRTAMLAAVAAIGLVGTTSLAHAQTLQSQGLTVELPGGVVAHIRYTGNVPPQVVMVPAPTALDTMASMPAMFGPDSPFAQMERISAEMDQQAMGLLQQVQQMASQPLPGPAQLTQAALSNLPPGSTSYEMVSTLSGNDVCTRSVEITTSANGIQHVVSHSSGPCRAGSEGAVPARVPAYSAPTQLPHTILADAKDGNARQNPYYRMVGPATDWQP